jgi:CDP-diacylglycerol---glycerol-3-phosphate 3-phosphatidyltransferase
MIVTPVLKVGNDCHKVSCIQQIKKFFVQNPDQWCTKHISGRCFFFQQRNYTEATKAKNLFSLERKRLINIARGGSSDGMHINNRISKIYPLRYHNVPSIDNPILTPSQFHSQICKQIRSAKKRVILASLYIGPAAGSVITTSAINYDSKEHELLSSLAQLTSSSNVDVKILLDRNRALRKVPIPSKESVGNEKETTTSASACYRALRLGNKTRNKTVDCNQPFSHQSAEVYLISVLPKYLQMILPNPLNEIAGVFHIKCYIVDDDMIISGANLSEEYFTDRTDRYLWIRGDTITRNETNLGVDIASPGNCGLVECYADMITLMCRHAHLYEETEAGEVKHRPNDRSRLSRMQLMKSLTETLTVESTDNHELDNIWMDEDTIAVAIPTFQTPKSYLGLSRNPIPSDVNVMCTFLEETASDMAVNQRVPSLRLATAYFNPTNQLLKAIKKFPVAFFLSAGKISHGFRPKTKQLNGTKQNNSSSRTDWIPHVFDELARQAILKLQIDKSHVSQLWLYERKDWTYHAKGIWLTNDRNESSTPTASRSSSVGTNDIKLDRQSTPSLRINDASMITAITVGSSNYGGRSDRIDMESNVILFFPDLVATSEVSKIQQLFQDEWNSLANFAVSGNTQQPTKLSNWFAGLVPICRYFF